MSRENPDPLPTARATDASIGFRSLAFRATAFVALFAFAFVFCGAEVARAQGSDQTTTHVAPVGNATYAEALAYCRGNGLSSETLRADKRVLCLDGRISRNSEIWLANGFEHGGIFVVRSKGGDMAATIALADLPLLKEATVVINDYCLAACADYLFIPTAKTFVPKDALVGWAI
jgi:hypothetical protein